MVAAISPAQPLKNKLQNYILIIVFPMHMTAIGLQEVAEPFGLAIGILHLAKMRTMAQPQRPPPQLLPQIIFIF